MQIVYRRGLEVSFFLTCSGFSVCMTISLAMSLIVELFVLDIKGMCLLYYISLIIISILSIIRLLVPIIDMKMNRINYVDSVPAYISLALVVFEIVAIWLQVSIALILECYSISLAFANVVLLERGGAIYAHYYYVRWLQKYKRSASRMPGEIV